MPFVRRNSRWEGPCVPSSFLLLSVLSFPPRPAAPSAREQPHYPAQRCVKAEPHAHSAPCWALLIRATLQAALFSQHAPTNQGWGSFLTSSDFRSARRHLLLCFCQADCCFRAMASKDVQMLTGWLANNWPGLESFQRTVYTRDLFFSYVLQSAIKFVSRVP